MTAWAARYIPVPPPTKSKAGWKYPYNGDDWPAKNDWYWVWACKPNQSPDSIFMLPTIAWWDEEKERFMAMSNKTVYAWHKAVRFAEVE